MRRKGEEKRREGNFVLGVQERKEESEDSLIFYTYNPTLSTNLLIL